MNLSKNENHSTLLHEKFKRFNTVQLQELTVADKLENPTLNFPRTLFKLLGCYNKKIGLTTFPSKNHENRRRIHKKSINRLIF
jgi:hypothetical protein